MKPKEIEHFIVYRSEAHFCAWPFTGGMWQFADGEIVVGFTRGKANYGDAETLNHGNVEHGGAEHLLIRSTDDGRTWAENSISTLYNRLELDEKVTKAPAAAWSDESYDPTADGYMLVSGHGNPHPDYPKHAFSMVSTDRGNTWTDPIRLPTHHPFAGDDTFCFATSRPSYIVRSDGMLLLFGAATRVKDRRHWGVGAVPVVYASWNGGASWGFLSEVELTHPGLLGVMPYPLLLENGNILMAVRRQYNGYNAFTQIYQSQDDGRSWSYLSRVNDWGAPANLTLLPDGRIVCVYGYRQQPWGIRARISEDSGQTWGSEIILRADGGSWDLGYPRTLLLPDGSLLSVYYFNSKDDPIQQEGGVRHIAATKWRV